MNAFVTAGKFFARVRDAACFGLLSPCSQLENNGAKENDLEVPASPIKAIAGEEECLVGVDDGRIELEVRWD